MDGENLRGKELAHHLKNKEQEKRALQTLLARAADELDDLAKADCEDEAIAHAKQTAERLRRASGA